MPVDHPAKSLIFFRKGVFQSIALGYSWFWKNNFQISRVSVFIYVQSHLYVTDNTRKYLRLNIYANLSRSMKNPAQPFIFVMYSCKIYCKLASCWYLLFWEIDDVFRASVTVCCAIEFLENIIVVVSSSVLK